MKSLIAVSAFWLALFACGVGDTIAQPTNCREVTDISIVGRLNVYQQCNGGFTGMALKPVYVRPAN